MYNLVKFGQVIISVSTSSYLSQHQTRIVCHNFCEQNKTCFSFENADINVTLTLTTTEQSNLFTWQSILWWIFLHGTGSWYCITIANLLTKFSVTQKKSSIQTFTDILNLQWDLDHKHSNHLFPQDTPAYDVVLSNHVWLQTNQQFRRYNRKSYFDYISPCCDLDIEHSEPIFLHDTLAYEAA